jgi:hypothetical protein
MTRTRGWSPIPDPIPEEEAREKDQRFLARRRRRMEERTVLYRHLDAGDQLLYVGVSSSPERRDAEHVRSSVWAELVTWSTSNWFESTIEAETAEIVAIRTEEPIFNVAYGAPDRDHRVVAYLVEIGRPDLIPRALGRKQ